MKATGYFGLLAVILAINAVSILGAAVLDSRQYDTITKNTDIELDRRFQERSTKIGAWIMDRDCIARHIGFPIEELPSYKWQQQHNQETP